MRFSYSAVWEDTVRLLRAHGSLAVALAGVFLFLPALVTGHFLPLPETSDPADFLPKLAEHFRANVHWMVLSGIVSMAGTLAILMLVFRHGMAVGGAIGAALAFLPFYFLANFLATISIIIGILFFILPGLYLIGRLLPLAPAMVAENLKNPAAALGRTWALTAGHGWTVLGMFVLVFIAGFILTAVVSGVIGAILVLTLSESLSDFLNLVVESLLSAVLQVVTIFLYAAIYRALAARTEAAGAAEGFTAPRPPARTTGTGTGAGTGGEGGAG
jgi:hypothetical protein